MTLRCEESSGCSVSCWRWSQTSPWNSPLEFRRSHLEPLTWSLCYPMQLEIVKCVELEVAIQPVRSLHFWKCLNFTCKFSGCELESWNLQFKITDFNCKKWSLENSLNTVWTSSHGHVNFPFASRTWRINFSDLLLRNFLLRNHILCFKVCFNYNAKCICTDADCHLAGEWFVLESPIRTSDCMRYPPVEQ